MIVLSLARSGQIGLKCASPIYINETQPSLLVEWRSIILSIGG
jgi:hypothetical protein